MIEILKPSFIPDTSKARKVLRMTGKDDAEDLKANEDELTKFLKKKFNQESREKRQIDKAHGIRIRRLRDEVRKAKAKWDQAVKNLEGALGA